MEKFAFIILNYNSTEETMRCISSILKLTYEEKYIIVVDNASPDQQNFFSTLKKHYLKEKNISYLCSKENTGYAKGNNIGIYYAKNVLHVEYVCVINPDVIIHQDNFIEKCIELYGQYRYTVLGPKIIKNGTNSNPLGGYIESSIYCMLHYIENYRIYYVKKWNLKRFNFFKIKLSNKKRNGDNSSTNRNIESKLETFILSKEMKVQLSGACIIFSPRFLENFNGFCKETFLYCEECILACVCFNLGHKLLYSSELEVMHEGGKSMINSEKNDSYRQMYVCKVGAHSCKVAAKVFINKRNKAYLKSCLNPRVSEYYEV